MHRLEQERVAAVEIDPSFERLVAPDQKQCDLDDEHAGENSEITKMKDIASFVCYNEIDDTDQRWRDQIGDQRNRDVVLQRIAFLEPLETAETASGGDDAKVVEIDAVADDKHRRDQDDDDVIDLLGGVAIDEGGEDADPEHHHDQIEHHAESEHAHPDRELQHDAQQHDVGDGVEVFLVVAFPFHVHPLHIVHYYTI